MARISGVDIPSEKRLDIRSRTSSVSGGVRASVCESRPESRPTPACVT